MGLTEIETSDITTILKRIFPDLWAIYLYGSMATHRENAESDLDLAILGSKKLELPALNQARGEIFEAVSANGVDLIDLRAVPTTLIMQVIADGKWLANLCPKEVASWETTAMSQYVNLNEERKAILSDIKKRGRIYGG